MDRRSVNLSPLARRTKTFLTERGREGGGKRERERGADGEKRHKEVGTADSLCVLLPSGYCLQRSTLFFFFHLRIDSTNRFSAGLGQAIVAARSVTQIGDAGKLSLITPHRGHGKKRGLYHDDRLREGFDLMRAAWA